MLERLEWPLSSGPQRRPQRIDLRGIRPVIHLAHRVTYPLVLPERVIFDYEIVLVLRGEGEFLTECSVQSFAPGDLLVIPPYVPHRFAGLVSQSIRAQGRNMVHLDWPQPNITFREVVQLSLCDRESV
jgi:hypothetical protein